MRLTGLNTECMLLLHYLGEAYRPPSLRKPTAVNWKRLERELTLNKLQLLAYRSILSDPDLDVPHDWANKFKESLAIQEMEHTKLDSSLSKLNEIVGEVPYAIVKTYRPFPYHTHDVDVLVADARVIGSLATEMGIPWDDIPAPSVQIEEPQWLHLEFYEAVLPGSIKVIDDELGMRNPVPMVLANTPIYVASPEIEAITLIADAVLRLYELKLGDMIYIYSLADRIDWQLLQEQAAKHEWLESFMEIIGVLNSVHQYAYGVASPIARTIPYTGPIPTNIPYVPGWGATFGALSRAGKRHLIKLPGYYSVRLKRFSPQLHSAYVACFLEPVGRWTLRWLYR
jgi:hypothetical protein